ncbi:MAG: hypothetical protein AAF196_06100 [Planctomycetota bacterium]
MRLTKERKSAASKLLDECLRDGKDATAVADLRELLDAQNTDRSCYSCDRLKPEDFCTHWDQRVPSEHMEDGCEDHVGVGTPF